MPDFTYTGPEHGFEAEPEPETIGVISPEEPVQLDEPDVPFETAVIMSLNAVHDRLDAIGSQNDWLCTATEQIHGMTTWVKTTVESLVQGMMATPMGAMIKSKLPKV